MSHRLIDDVHFSAKFRPHRGAPTGEQCRPQWFKHLRACYECARNWMEVPSAHSRYCEVGAAIPDGHDSVKEATARGAKNQAEAKARKAAKRAARRALEGPKEEGGSP